MLRFRVLIAVVVCLTGLAAQAQVRKCVLANGKTVYQDSACEEGTGKPVVVVPTSMGGVNGAGGSLSEMRARGDKSNAAYDEARRQWDEGDPVKQCLKLPDSSQSKCLDALPVPKIGMPAIGAISSRWGLPERFDTSETAAGKFDIWFYKGGGKLTLKDGVVVQIDKTTGPALR